MLRGEQAPLSLLAADIARSRLEVFASTRLNQCVDAPGVTNDRALAAKSLLRLMFTAGSYTHRAIRNSIGERAGRTADFIRREEDRLLAELAGEFVADSHSREPELTHEPAPLLISLALHEVANWAKATIELHDRYWHEDRAALVRKLPSGTLAAAVSYGDPPLPDDAVVCFGRLEEAIRSYVSIRDSLYLRQESAVAALMYLLDHVLSPALREPVAEPPPASQRGWEALNPTIRLGPEGPYVDDAWLAWRSLLFMRRGVGTEDMSSVWRLYVNASALACLAASISEAALAKNLADVVNAAPEEWRGLSMIVGRSWS